MPDTQTTFADLPILTELRSELSRAFTTHTTTVTPPSRSRRRWSPRTRLLAAIPIPALCAAAIVALVLNSNTHQPAHSHATGPSTTTGTRSGHTTATNLHLMGYTFKLPATYQTSSTTCATMPGGVSPLIGASSNEGCVELAIASGPDATAPADAQPINSGALHGEMVTPAPGQIELYLDLPAQNGQTALIIATTGRTLAEDLQLAESGLIADGQLKLPDYQNLLPGSTTPPAGA